MNSAVRLLDSSAEKFPDRAAFEDENTAVTFSELRSLARSVATALLRFGGGEEGISPVVVYLPKSVSCIVSFMGALYSGSPYAPVDAHIPMARLQKIIENLSPGHIITTAALSSNLREVPLGGAKVHLYEELVQTPADESLVEAALDAVIDTDPIYMMYTSGSTGAPKGVTIPHRGVIDYAEWVVNTFAFDENTVMANQAPFYFDNSVFDIYGCLACGGKMVMIPESLLLFPLKLPEFLEQKEITSIFWVPTVMINVANSGVLADYKLPKLKNVAFCGEVMPNTQLNIWRREVPHCTYANLYGPTEITDVCCYYKVDRDFQDHEPLPIGRACENMRVLILNEKDEIAAPNEQGELCVLGTGVALGYFNAPELTARAFVQNPVNKAYDERMYRTGDLAYRNDEGLILFLGRKDSQIKLKGNRIELGEIETAAMCVEGVSNACAVFDSEKQEIVLFVETRGTLPPRRFNMELKKYIPQYMLPSKMVTMEQLPHTANDKIDRVKLRASL